MTELKSQLWSQGYDTGNDSNCDGDTDDAIEALQRQHQRPEVPTNVLKKPVELNLHGYPHGSMMLVLKNDVKKYAKNLDPTTGWEGQPRRYRRGLFKQLYTEWDMVEDSNQINERWLQPIITKVLINLRWRVNQVIDAGHARPTDVDAEHWKTLQAMRATEAAQTKSTHMRAISKGKGSTTVQMKAIEREAIPRLTLLKGHPPFDPEVDAEVAAEY